MRAVLALGVLLLLGCASAADLRPGTLTGVFEDGFEQTTEGLALTVRGRSLEDVWAATLRGAKAVTRSTAHLRIVDQEAREFLTIEGMNFLDSEIVSFTKIFLVTEGGTIQVQATKKYKARIALVGYGPDPADYLRAIQRELGPP